MLSKLKKGNIGEQIIFNEIDKLDIYKKIIVNVKIPTKNSDTQIDLIIITCNGIYVVESKNWNGIISRSKKDDWYVIYSFKIRKRVNSPVKQNQYHIDYLSKFLTLNPAYFKSYIVFNKKNKLKDNCLIADENVIILKSDEIVNKIIHDIKNQDILLTHEEIDKLYAKIKYMNI